MRDNLKIRLPISSMRIPPKILLVRNNIGPIPRGNHLLKNPDTYRKLSMYVDIDFVRGLFDPYMKEKKK